MTVMQFFGALFIAYGPAIAMFLFTIVHEPLWIIIMIAGMFFWLISLLIASIWWIAVVPLKEDLAFALVFSVLFQEAFRYIYFRILRKAEDGLQQFNEPDRGSRNNGTSTSVTSETSQHMYAYVSGFGFGVMSGLFSFSNVLADSKGPGTVGLNDDPYQFLLTSAFLTMAFVLLHTFWNVIFFWGCEHRNYIAVSYVVISHLGVSCLTLLLNSHQLYGVVLPIVYAVLLVTVVAAFNIAGGTFKSARESISTSIGNSYKIQ